MKKRERGRERERERERERGNFVLPNDCLIRARVRQGNVSEC